MVQLSHLYMTPGKTIALTRWTFVGKVMSLLFNMLSRLVITFFPRSKYPFYFMAAVTICSDFGAPPKKSATVSTVSPSICHEVMGPDVTFSSVQSLSCVRLFATPWIAERQTSLSITNSQSALRLTSIEAVMPSSNLILCRPLLLLPPIPPNESFPMSQLFAWGGQSTGVSALASLLPKKSQGWSPSEWTGWISLQSKGLPRVFSNTLHPY